MNEFEVYFNDLTEEAQKRYLDFMGVSTAKELNADVFPITVITDEKEPDEYFEPVALREIESIYELEDGQLDGLSREEIEKICQVEPGELDIYLDGDNDIEDGLDIIAEVGYEDEDQYMNT